MSPVVLIEAAVAACLAIVVATALSGLARERPRLLLVVLAVLALLVFLWW